MTRAPTLLLLLVPALAAAQALATSAAPPAMAAPAQWRSYDLLLEFRALPRTYSCDELWYKVRDVLLQLGARPYMTITPYHCGTTRGGEARSPSVEVKFQLLEPLPGAAARYADTTVREEAVRLAPGTPSSLKAGDCELMRQLRETLLTGVPLHVAAAAFSCTAAANSFALIVDAPTAAQGSATPRS